MKALPRTILAIGIAASLSACAGFAPAEPEYERLAQVHPGLTRDEVQSIAGTPYNYTGSKHGDTEWTYSYDDEWGYPSEFDVTFNANGVVTGMDGQRDR